MSTNPKDYLPILKNGQEVVFSQINLEYFGPDENGNKPLQPDLVCVACKTKGISLGSANFNPLTGEMEPICEKCETQAFAQRYGYKDLEAATRRRRRIFDVHYLFVEKLAKSYEALGEFSNEEWEDEELERLFVYAQQVWSKLPQDTVLKLEMMPEQKDIESALDGLIESKNYIVGLTVFMSMMGQ